MGCVIEPRNDDIAEAEAAKVVEGNMYGIAMSAALPGSALEGPRPGLLVSLVRAVVACIVVACVVVAASFGR